MAEGHTISYSLARGRSGWLLDKRSNGRSKVLDDIAAATELRPVFRRGRDVRRDDWGLNHRYCLEVEWHLAEFGVCRMF